MPLYDSVPSFADYLKELDRLRNEHNGTLPGMARHAKLACQEVSDKLIRDMTMATFIVMMFGMGLATSARNIIRSFRKLALGATIGLLCQFLIMPCVALAAVKAKLFTKSEALIVVLLGACPGGGASNLFTYYLDLNLDLSIVMTNVSALLAFGFTPLWLLTVPYVVDDIEFSVPHAEIATGLAQLVGPLVLGVILNHFAEKKSRIAARVIVAVSTILIIVCLILQIYKYFPQSIITKAQVIFAFLFPLLGCTLGIILSATVAWVISKTCKVKQNLTARDCITIGIETGIQNVKIAVTIVFLVYKLPDQLYEFAQQLYFPLLYLGAQICYWFVGMVIFYLYRLKYGDPWAVEEVQLEGRENEAYEETKEMS